MTETPSHLIKRKELARELNSGETRPRLESNALSELSPLESRLSGIVDMNSEPCSLLAQSVATTAKYLITNSSLYLHGNQGNRSRVFSEKESGIRTYQIGSGYESAAQTVDLHTIPLCVLKNNQADAIVLASELQTRSASRKRWFGAVAVGSAKAINDKRATVLVTLRGNVAIPLFDIWMSPSNFNCSFVRFTSADPSEIGDVIVTKSEDTTKEDKARALRELRKILEAKKQYSPATTANLSDLGVYEYREMYFGAYHELTEKTISELLKKLRLTKSRVFHTKPQSASCSKNVQISEDSYQAMITLEPSVESDSNIVIESYMTLQNLPHLGRQQALPSILLSPASRYPITFSGVDPETEEHIQLLSDLSEIIESIN